MKQRQLGAVRSSAIGLGCMGLSGAYGPSDRAESLAVIHAALDGGIDLLDTGDFYGMGHNEMLLGEALREVPRDRVLVSLKFGALRDPAGAFVGFDGRPAAAKAFLAYSLQRLGLDHVDVYRPARLDPDVPIEDTVGAVADLVHAGYVRHIGLSEVGADTIRRAAAVHPIADLQIEYSLVSRGVEASILPTCRELDIGITAYGVLSRGLLSGTYKPGAVGDYRSHSPRFQGENLARNEALAAALHAVAHSRGCSPAQAAISWVLAQGNDIVPIIGCRRIAQLADAIGALALTLDPDDLAAIENAVPKGSAAGARYPEALMAALDSER